MSVYIFFIIIKCIIPRGTHLSG